MHTDGEEGGGISVNICLSVSPQGDRGDVGPPGPEGPKVFHFLPVVTFSCLTVKNVESGPSL